MNKWIVCLALALSATVAAQQCTLGPDGKPQCDNPAPESAPQVPPQPKAPQPQQLN